MKYYWMAFKKFADFSGRSTRQEYWEFVLAAILISVAANFFSMAIIKEETLDFFNMIHGFYNLVLITPWLAFSVRRMHDVGKSGWYILIPVYSFILLCTNSEKRTNQYGPNPKAVNTNTESDLDDIESESSVD